MAVFANLWVTLSSLLTVLAISVVILASLLVLLASYLVGGITVCVLCSQHIYVLN